MGPDTLTIDPGKAGHYELTYLPMTMTSDSHKHQVRVGWAGQGGPVGRALWASGRSRVRGGSGRVRQWVRQWTGLSKDVVGGQHCGLFSQRGSWTSCPIEVSVQKM